MEGTAASGSEGARVRVQRPSSEDIDPSELGKGLERNVKVMRDTLPLRPRVNM